MPSVIPSEPYRQTMALESWRTPARDSRDCFQSIWGTGNRASQADATAMSAAVAVPHAPGLVARSDPLRRARADLPCALDPRRAAQLRLAWFSSRASTPASSTPSASASTRHFDALAFFRGHARNRRSVSSPTSRVNRTASCRRRARAGLADGVELRAWSASTGVDLEVVVDFFREPMRTLRYTGWRASRSVHSGKF